MFFLKRLLFPCAILCACGIPHFSTAQCVTAFPYTEDFESSDGSWTTGGNASDWKWGTPVKSVINKAGSGTKCWITGTLTGNYYNENESSWLQSPCFDFTQIQQPRISFYVNWDTEYGYDGAALQYSDNNGSTWQSVGSSADGNDCATSNWYNTNNIRYGVQQQGWSGSGGSGSKGWVLAMYTMPNLGGRSKVIFRFVFGAGKVQNNFNGFAIDKVSISESPASGEPAFSYICEGGKRVTFVPKDDNPCLQLESWDFGDPASGSTNSADGKLTVSHTFSAAGTYRVTLSATGIDGKKVTGKLNLILPELEASVLTPVDCYGAEGVLLATLTNTTAHASYNWTTTPPITKEKATVKAGTYTVEAGVEGGCKATATITLTEPSALQHSIAKQQPYCSNKGSVSIAASGGVSPFTYQWLPAVSTTNTADNLSPGLYKITITDANHCIDTVSITLTDSASPLQHTVAITQPDCNAGNGSIDLSLTGGKLPYTYQWSNGLAYQNPAQQLKAGNYEVWVNDADGCRDTIDVSLQNKPFLFSLGNDTVLCSGEKLRLEPLTTYASYHWYDGFTGVAKEITTEGYYWLTVTNEGGCTATDTIRVFSGCGDIVFPSAFSPNGDNRNDKFGPKGGLSQVTHYRLLVYNRFGNLVYQTTNPYDQWNGLSVSGRVLAGTFVYVATYTYKGDRKWSKGTLTLLL